MKKLLANKKTITTIVVAIILVVVCTVLSFMKPSESEMVSQASDTMQSLVEKDENSSRKRVTITYNSMIVINYCSFSSSGAKQINERFVGFC